MSNVKGISQSVSPKIVVVGAGIAGLTTAYRLYEKGFDVHVYEAKNRVGGRIFTATIDGNIVELGGKDIADGDRAENFYRLVHDFNLELIKYSIPNNPHYVCDNGLFSMQELLDDLQLTPDEIKNRLDAVVPRATNMREVLNQFFSEHDPIYKMLSVRLAAYEGASIEKLSPLYASTLYHMLLGGVCYAHQDNTKIDLISVKGGNSLLPESISEKLGDRVHINSPLVSVSKKPDGSYFLTFKNGKTDVADILVLAIPCSVYHKIVFEDGVIPDDKLTAIKNVQYGTNAKILVPCSDRGQSYANNHVLSWYESNKILTLYYICKGAFFCTDSINQLYDADQAFIALSFDDKNLLHCRPVIARDESFAAYEGSVGHSWPNDPFVLGSYSYIASGQESILMQMHQEVGESVKTLFAPIDQRLYFAGEHTTILLEVLGTMEAACESGERIARIIENTYPFQV